MLSRLALLVLLLTPAAAYVAPNAAGAKAPRQALRSTVQQPLRDSMVETESSTMGSEGLLGAMAFAAGAVLGWLRSRKQEVAATAAAVTVAVAAPMAANAMIDYEGVPYQGGTDIVDINNANVQAYRQFRGMFPTAAGFIATHGPYKEVADLYKIPQLPEECKAIIKKYEKQFIVLPYNEAYGLDRINNGMYR